jgi:hypothetical protein
LLKNLAGMLSDHAPISLFNDTHRNDRCSCCEIIRLLIAASRLEPASMINDPYPTTLSPAFGVPLSLVLNFGAPVVAYLFSLRLKRWPHVVVCLWEITSIAISGILLFPKIPSDEAPGPGDGLLLIPTLLSVAVILFGYCIALLWKFLSFILPGSPILSTGAHAEPEKWRAGDRFWRKAVVGQSSDV